MIAPLKVAWFDGARLLARGVTKWVAKYAITHDQQSVKSELLALAGACRLSQNIVETPVDIRLLIAKTGDFGYWKSTWRFHTSGETLCDL